MIARPELDIRRIGSVVEGLRLPLSRWFTKTAWSDAVLSGAINQWLGFGRAANLEILDKVFGLERGIGALSKKRN